MKRAILNKVPRDGTLPFSINQYQILDLSPKYPSAPPHYWHLPAALKITGELDIGILKRCLHELGQRHESIRTGFITVNGQLQVRIHETVSVDVPVVEIEQPAQLEPLMRDLIHRPFDLSMPPLGRFMLFRLAANHHILALAFHHLIADAWSQTIFLRELAKLYTAFKAGQTASLPPLKYQYVDYAAWEYGQLHTEAMARKVDYWRQNLQGMPSLLKLATDRPRPLQMNLEGGTELFSLSPQLSKQLAIFARQQRVTLFTPLLAAFFVLMYKYSTQTDIVVGVPVANRSRSAFRHIIGPLAKILPLRQHLSTPLTVTDLIQQVYQSSREALANQAAPFGSLIKDLNLRFHPGHHLLNQVSFIFQNAVLSRLELPGLSLEFDPSVWRTLGVARNDVVWQMYESDHGLIGSVEYRLDLFDASTIQGMVMTYQDLLTGFMADPNRTISTLLQDTRT